MVPAIGCTEPVCVALAAARAAEQLPTRPPHRVQVRLSANILKNAMGVGIPGTDMVGLPIAIALGVLIGRSANGLEVLRDVTPDDVAAGKAYIAERRIDITLAQDISEKLYVDVTATDRDGHERAPSSRDNTPTSSTAKWRPHCATPVVSPPVMQPTSTQRPTTVDRKVRRNTPNRKTSVAASTCAWSMISPRRRPSTSSTSFSKPPNST